MESSATDPGRGWLITFEGGEGAGKTTQIRRLCDTLATEGVAPVIVREPGGTPAGEAVRRILLDPAAGPRASRAELLLYLAARAELVDTVVEPALASGRVVICDRFIDASVAYQGGGRRLGESVVTSLNDFATGGLIPHLTFLLDVDPEVGLDRVAGRGRPDRLEQEALDFHQRVRDAYLSLADDPRVVRLDATLDPDHLAARIRASVESLLSR